MSFELKQHPNRELTGGDLLAQTLKRIGAEVAFGVHGGHLDAFLVGCEHAGIKIIDTRHETVAVQAAEGYAKVSGKLGVCFVTANSGFGNGLPGLATAFADRSPIFCVTSSPPLRDLENNSLQAFLDQVVVAKPITKFAHRVTHGEEIPRLVNHAVRVALGGAPGPVLIDFPIDVLFTPIQEKLISWGAITSPPAYKPAPSTAAVQEAVKLLKTSQRPVIITGTGVGSSEVSDKLLALASEANIPLFQSPKFAPLPADHPNVAGLAVLLPYASPKPDLVLLLGCRSGMFLGLRSGAIIPDSAKIIHVDIDGTEPGRTLPTELSITSSTSVFLSALQPALHAESYQAPKAWLQTAMSLQTMASPHDDEPDYPTPSRMHPHKAISAFFRSLPPESIIISDGGEAGAWSFGLQHLAKPSLHMIPTGYLGFLGNGFGYSLGAATAKPDRFVVNVQGDGSAGFHFMELDTYARFGVRVCTVVVNNSAWGMSVHGQELVYGEKDAARPASALKDVKWATVAEGLGVRGVRVEKLTDVEKMTREVLGGEGPSCVDLPVSSRPIHSGTTAMVGMTDDPDMVVVPYYDNVPRARYKL